MGKCSGYKCDYCGKITEEKQLVVEDDRYKFSVNKAIYIESYASTVCSIECAHNALNKWYADRVEEDRLAAEAKKKAEEARVEAEPVEVEL